MDGWKEVKSVLRIAYSNQRSLSNLKKKESGKTLNPGLGKLNLGTPGWKPDMLTTTACRHIHCSYLAKNLIYLVFVQKI